MRNELEKTILLLKIRKEKLEEEFNTFTGQEKWQTTKNHFGNAIGELKKTVEALLNKNEKKWLNDYHKTVFRNLVKSMNKFEVLELRKACSAI